jgi:tRNA threonylcarbamoyladenosine biosynthesis protein TsaB
VRLPFLSVRTRSANETNSLGRRVGAMLLPGELLLLMGELGTGKTTFVQGVAQGMGARTKARSPTFTLVHTHEGTKFPLVHVDLFRCANSVEVLGLGLEELFEPPAVAAVEWGEKALEIAGRDYLELEFAWDPNEDDTRTIKFLPFGRWRDRMRELSETVRSWAGERSQDQVLMPAAQRMLSDTALDWDQLGGVAVGIGPGLFTGLRVGVATAKALAHALGISIAGLSSLDVLAYSVRYTRRSICSCIDARRNEVFWAFYRSVPGGVQRLTDFRCAPASHCVNEIEARGEPVLAVGNGPYVYARDFEELGANLEVAGISDSTPTAVPLTELAVSRLLREDSDRLVDVRPLYIRKSDAEMKWDTR